MVGCKDTSNVAKKLRKLHRKKSNNWPMVSSIHNFKFKLKIIRLDDNSLKQLFYSYTYEKNIFSSSFYQRVFFVELLTEKLWVWVTKYYLLARDTSQVSIFFLT